MKLTPHRTTKYARILRRTWENDASLLTTYHAIAAPDLTLTAAVANSVAVLESDKVAQDFAFYELRAGAETVGFFGIEPGNNCLITFGLAVGCRTPEGKAALWDSIRTFTDANRPLFCVLHAHNERAQRFLEAGGFRLINRVVFEGHPASLFLR